MSRTPYVPPRHAYRSSGRIREAEAPAAQLRREVTERVRLVIGEAQLPLIKVTPRTESSLLASGRIERCRHTLLRNTRAIRCLAFVQHRRIKEARDGRLHHGQLGGAWIIELPEPIRGPIALGYGAHFGLGQFVPEET